MLLRALHRGLVILGVTGLAALWLAAGGCGSSPQAGAGSAPATQPHAASPRGIAGIGKAELWATTCSRCHNLWSPDQFSAVQWKVIVHHMRLRATLTGEEQQAILEFLESASR